MPKAPPRFGGKPDQDRKPWRTSTKTTTQRGYGWSHQKARERLLKSEPLCRECAKHGRVTAATIADHTVPLAETGVRAPSELQPLCGPCHTAKTQREAQRGLTGY